MAFDMDGTLTISGLDFDAIRREAGVPEGVSILDFIETAPPARRQKARRVLLEHEWRDARSCRLRPGVAGSLEALRRRGLKTALLTRNSRRSVEVILSRFSLEFDCCITRDDGSPKPSPEPVLKAAHALGLDPSELLVVGDYVYDIRAGRAAGACTAFLHTEKARETPPADIILSRFEDVLSHVPAALV